MKIWGFIPILLTYHAVAAELADVRGKSSPGNSVVLASETTPPNPKRAVLDLIHKSGTRSHIVGHCVVHFERSNGEMWANVVLKKNDSGSDNIGENPEVVQKGGSRFRIEKFPLQTGEIKSPGASQDFTTISYDGGVLRMRDTGGTAEGPLAAKTKTVDIFTDSNGANPRQVIFHDYEGPDANPKKQVGKLVCGEANMT